MYPAIPSTEKLTRQGQVGPPFFSGRQPFETKGVEERGKAQPREIVSRGRKRKKKKERKKTEYPCTQQEEKRFQ